MLPSFVSNLFWGEPKEDETASEEEVVEHTISEEVGDWLVIDCNCTAGENESVSSETSTNSWIVAPSPRFRPPSATSSTHHHSMENLLLEHPTMSFYAQRQEPLPANEQKQETKNEQTFTQDPSEMQVAIRNQNRQVVLYHNHARQQLAAQLGIPWKVPKPPQNEPAAGPTHPKPTKKSLKKHNENMIRVTRGKKAFKIHHCGVKAGRRRS